MSDSISRFYNTTQLRADTWTRQKHLTARLVEPGATAGDIRAAKQSIRDDLGLLEPIERYWAFPGMTAFRHLRRLLDQEDFPTLNRLATRIVRALIDGSYRRRPVPLVVRDDQPTVDGDHHRLADGGDDEDDLDSGRPYFEVLIVDDVSDREVQRLRDGLRSVARSEDRFTYDLVVVPSLEDAIIAVLFNPTIQSCVIHHGFRRRSTQELGSLRRHLENIDALESDNDDDAHLSLKLARMIGELRPELDCFLMTDQSLESIAGQTPANVRRVFYSKEDALELHLNILRGIAERYKTPFFTALKDYSVQPTGVFHAMPISRGKSITKSHWIQDMARFYGINIFLAETSATSGGLDSLLDPHGPIKKAQERAATAFGAQRTFFVTNGTSTANKIVLQALVQPDDIVLVDRNCHKSHHYGFVLSGARVRYLDAYPIHGYSMYGAVPLRELKRALIEYKAAGLLDRVKMVLLTNCTFDGIVYNVERVMQECLAIKPDLVFLWDEAWFAFARCDPMYRQRTAMDAARKLRERYRSESYRRDYEAFRESFGEPDPKTHAETWINTALLPDPDRVRIRTYATQSTHKTLSSLRQGSMIHIFDQDYASVSEESFHEAFMTHTSTSPNYQIIASLDVGRRQVQLEGFEMVQKQVEMAMVLRQQVTSHPLLSRYFSFLTLEDMIPDEFRASGLERYYDEKHGWTPMLEAWANDEFVLDPCRLTLFIGETGVDGDTFKNEYLMRKHGIQINKTSRNSVLFMTHIGTTRSSVAYLIEVLVKIAREFEETDETSNRIVRAHKKQRVEALTRNLPPLPDFSRFHGAFRMRNAVTDDGDIRSAYFLAMDEARCDYIPLAEIDAALASDTPPVSSKFVIPYPPGFPLLVPGQVITAEVIEFMRKLDVKEIHGYQPDLGLRVFRNDVLCALVAGEHNNTTQEETVP